MPLKRRRPKDRTVAITPRALELFLELQRHSRGCDEWYDLHLLLHRELQCRPWEYPLDSRNAPHIWEALEKAAEVAELRERSETAPATS
jgi:hypothetical protein